MEQNNQAPQQPSPTPPSTNPNPATPTPPKGPVDHNGNPLPPLTKGQKVKYSVIALIFVAVIGGLIAWSVSSSNKEDARISELKTNGTKVIGTANGDAYEYTDRSKRGGTSIRYKAKYDYFEQGQASTDPEEAYTAIGEKLYDTEEEVQALKGQKADVYYNGKGGSYVEDDK